MSVILQHSMPHFCLSNYVIGQAALKPSLDVQHILLTFLLNSMVYPFQFWIYPHLMYWRPPKDC